MQLKHWASELSAEVCERLEQDLQENERRATLLTICYHYYQNKSTVSQSRSCALNSYKPEKMTIRCVEIISKSTQCPIAYLGISAGKFIPAKDNENLMNFFKSSKTKHTQDINNQKENVKLKCLETEDSIIKITNNLQPNKCISTFKINEMNNASHSKVKNIQNSQNSLKLNKQICNEKTDSSPTSSKLNNLIKTLNQRNKKLNNCNFNNSLDQNDFKESFFMNIFNSEKIKTKDTDTCNIEMIEINEDTNINFEYENLNENNVQKSEQNNHKNASDNSGEEYNESTSSENEKKQLSSNINLNNSINHKQSTTTLKDIFPDLNNIDLSVLALLPLDLQEEAKFYIQSQNKKDNTKEIIVRNTKGKNRSKTNNSKAKNLGGIYSFLIRKEPSNFVEVPSKQCAQCCQMIPLLKYQEHCDFHMAENLQKELNNSASQTVNIKRKGNISDISTNSIKRRSREDT